jgi:hypothetical protein
MLLFTLLAPALAWGMKEHLVLTEVAAHRLVADTRTPAELRAFLSRGLGRTMTLAEGRRYFAHSALADEADRAPTLEYHSVAPDLTDRAATSEWGVRARALHYVDLELFHPARRYRADLSALPAATDVPRDPRDPRWAEAGMLPFAVEAAVEKLADAFRRDDGDAALEAAGALAHYAQDNTQPHHATEDYESASYFGGAGPDVHAAFEWEGSDGRLPPQRREALWDAFVLALDAHFPAVSADPWLGTIEVARYSYRGLPTLGDAALAATRGGALDVAAFYDGPVLGLKARQMAWAVRRTEVLWISAWNAAHR